MTAFPDWNSAPDFAEDGGDIAAVLVAAVGSCPDIALVATESQVALALAAANLLRDEGVAACVVSVPWRERFFASGALSGILPGGVPRIVIVAGSPDPWRALAAPDGDVIGLRPVRGPARAGDPGAELAASLSAGSLGSSPDYVRAVAHDVIARAAGA